MIFNTSSRARPQLANNVAFRREAELVAFNTIKEAEMLNKVGADDIKVENAQKCMVFYYPKTDHYDKQLEIV